MRLRDEMVAGAVGGLAGGMLMTAFMTGASKAGMIDETLPHKVEQYIEEQLDQQAQTGPTQEKMLAQSGHVVYSTLLGAGYGALRATFDWSPLPSGPLCGVCLYGLNLMGVGPALGITRGPWNEQRPTVMRRMMIHAAFGAMTALVSEQVRQRMSEQTEGEPARHQLEHRAGQPVR
ncbi:MAG: hypothetical protein M5U01_32200 [Ardenticatenaceae bacterium]|nr:hypothetical protein [Ardenticatenaceae bacterium]